MLTFLYIVHVLIGVFLILVVLLQQGKGADLSVFGGGGTMTAFGARGAATMLHKLTVTSFILFIFTTITIGIFQAGDQDDSLMSGLVDPDAVEESAEGTTAGGEEEAAPEAEAEEGGLFSESESGDAGEDSGMEDASASPSDGEATSQTPADPNG